MSGTSSTIELNVFCCLFMPHWNLKGYIEVFLSRDTLLSCAPIGMANVRRDGPPRAISTFRLDVVTNSASTSPPATRYFSNCCCEMPLATSDPAKETDRASFAQREAVRADMAVDVSGPCFSADLGECCFTHKREA